MGPSGWTPPPGPGRCTSKCTPTFTRDSTSGGRGPRPALAPRSPPDPPSIGQSSPLPAPTSRQRAPGASPSRLRWPRVTGSNMTSSPAKRSPVSDPAFVMRYPGSSSATQSVLPFTSQSNRLWRPGTCACRCRPRALDVGSDVDLHGIAHGRGERAVVARGTFPRTHTLWRC